MMEQTETQAVLSLQDDGSTASQRETMPSDLSVFVEKPLKHGDGFLDSYIVYTVRTATTRTQFGGSEFSVFHRYSDFVWLRDMLLFELPDHVIPPLPPKHMTKMNKSDAAFLESRRAGLERFLRRVAIHPILSTNDCFVAFCTAKTHEFASVKKDKERSILNRVGDSVSHMATKLMIKDPNTDFVAKLKYINDFEARMKTMLSLNMTQLSLLSEFQLLLSEFSTAFDAMCELEPEMKPVLSAMHGANRNMYDACGALNSTFQKDFTEPMEDYLTYCESYRLLLKHRDGKQMEQQLVAEDLEARKEEQQDLLGSDQKVSIGAMMGKNPNDVKEEKLAKLSALISKLEKDLDVASDAVHVADEKTRIETDRWSEAMEGDVKQMFRSLADSQMEFFKTSKGAWTETISRLETQLKTIVGDADAPLEETLSF